MATKTTRYGRLMSLKIGGVTLENLRTKSFTQARDTREVTTADSADNEESVATIMRRNISFGGLYSEAVTSGAGVVALQSAYESGAPVTWSIEGSAGGDRKWSGSGTITKLDFEMPYDNNVEFSAELKPTGVVTFGSV